MPKSSKVAKDPKNIPPYNSNPDWPAIDGVPPGLDPTQYPSNRQVVSKNIPDRRIGIPNYFQFGKPDFSVNGNQLQFKYDQTHTDRLFFRVPKNSSIKKFPRPGDHITLPGGKVVRVEFCSAENNRATGYIEVSHTATRALISMVDMKR